MSNCESEDFESADEGNHDEWSSSKKERKNRKSSSNYEDSAAEPDVIGDGRRKKSSRSTKVPEISVVEDNKIGDGWSDFDINLSKGQDNEQSIDTSAKSSTNPTKSMIENKEPVAQNVSQKVLKEPSRVAVKKKEVEVTEKETVKPLSDVASKNKSVTEVESKQPEEDEGWDAFDDWGDENIEQSNPAQTQQAPDIRSVADRLSSTSNQGQKSSGWGWGSWGVDVGAIVNTASAGFNTISNHVSQGISTVLETGIGAPDPEELARMNKSVPPRDQTKVASSEQSSSEPSSERVEGFIPFGSLLSGVTKFVENTGTKVISGGLDTLETIGKKTMEVLQDGDPGLAKKRALFGLESDKPVLSQVLREAKSKAEDEDRMLDEKREAKEVHYETLFDDFEGLVHLEALEMLSKQVNMRIGERLRTADGDKRQEIKETLQQVAELCEMPEDDDDDEDTSADGATADSFQQRLADATRDLGLKPQFNTLVKHFTDSLNWLTENDDSTTDKAVYKQAVSCLAQYTALSMEVYHKTAEMLLVKSRRSTADEADALTQMTVVISKHVSELATRHTVKLNSVANGNKEQINNYVTNVFLEAGNSSTYIQNAFQLTLPILQVGAV